MKIKVTQEHIDKGVTLDNCLCPVALACKDAGLEQPRVDAFTVYVLGKHPYLYSLPRTARIFIANFDDHEPVHPFEFEIEVPE